MAKSMKVYEVVHDVPGHSFDPIGFQMSGLADAKKKLRTMKVRHPDAYICRVTYVRYAPAKKGR
mgnify:CR=1 FL=1